MAMNILVCGASGFIASQIVADLISAGHTLSCAVRNVSYTKTIFPNTKVISCDFTQDSHIDTWIPRLKSIDVVINCVGIFYHPNKKIIWAIHYHTPKALFDACVKVGVKQIIQISALGIEKSRSEYALSKKAADEYLTSLNYQSIILRPSLVFAAGSYGGTSLFRGLAGLPLVLPLPGQGDQAFQPIHVKDLAKAIENCIQTPSDKPLLLHAVGPKQIKLKDLLVKMRAWLGFKKTRPIQIPLVFFRIIGFFGDFIPNSVMNSFAFTMLMQNNISTPKETKKFHATIGFVPMDFATGLVSQPSCTQDRWHARLYSLKPVLKISIAFTWMFTALTSAFWYPKFASYVLLAQMGISNLFHPIFLYGASALDAGIGLAVLFSYRVRLVGILQISLVFFYTVLISWKLPYLWLEPFAPIVKNVPFIAAVLVWMTLEENR